MVRQQADPNYGIYDNEGLNPVYNGGRVKANILPNYYDIEPPVTYINNSPLGNVKVYDLDAEIEPIQRVQIASNVPNLANQYVRPLPVKVAISESQELTLPVNSSVQNNSTPSTIAPKSSNLQNASTASAISVKKPNYLLYGGGALVVGFLAYKFLKK